MSGPSEMGLQVAVADWHKRRFPKAEKPHVMLKAMAELGEVADALSGENDQRTVSTGDGDVVKECADVLVCLLALVGRFYPDADLFGAVWDKLAVLDDEHGTHRSGIGAMGNFDVKRDFAGDPWGTGAPLTQAEQDALRSWS